MGVRSGLLISLSTEKRHWMKCSRCHLKVIQNLIKYMPSFAKRSLEFCNFAVFSELGQFPLLISTIMGFLNFWFHILQSGSEPLISKAYLEHYNSSSDKCLWVKFVKSILCDLGFSHVWNNHSTFNSYSLLASIKNKLKERFISFWKKRMVRKLVKKLRTYKSNRKAITGTEAIKRQIPLLKPKREINKYYKRQNTIRTNC